jgi:hypothetical protein
MEIAKSRDISRKEAAMEKAIDLVSKKHFSLREASKKTGVAVTSLQRKIKNPARIPLPLGSTSYLTLSEIEALADTMKSPEHAENGVTLPVLKSLVLTLLEGKNRVPPSGSVSDSYMKSLQKKLKSAFNVTFSRANRTVKARIDAMTYENIPPFFHALQVIREASPEIVSEPGRIVVCDESPLHQQTEKVIIV